MRIIRVVLASMAMLLAGCYESDNEVYTYEVTLRDGSSVDVIANGYYTLYEGMFNQGDKIHTFSFYYKNVTSATFRGEDVVSIRMIVDREVPSGTK